MSLLTSASFVTLRATVSNSPASNQAKRIVFRTVSRFPRVQLANVISDTFDKSAQAILDKLFENPADTSFDLEPLLYKSLKKKLPELRNAIDGYISPEQTGKPKVIKTHYENLESRKAELEELILALTAPISRNLPFSKPILASAVISLPSESSPKSAPIWRLFLRRNTYAYGLDLLHLTMKVLERKIIAVTRKESLL